MDKKLINIIETTLKLDFFHLSGGVFYTPHVDTKTMPWASVVQPLAGQYEISYDCAPPYVIKPGDVYITMANDSTAISHIMDPMLGYMSSRWVFFNFRVLDTVDPLTFFKVPRVMPRNISASFGEMFEQVANLDEEDIRTVLKRKSVAYQMLSLIFDISEVDEDEVERIEDYSVLHEIMKIIKKNLGQNLSIPYLAERCGLSVSHFHTLFKKLTGMSPAKYINDLRLSKACQMIITTNCSINQIAQETGFNDQFYFTKTFKAKYGVAPTSYRKSNTL